MNTVKIHQSLVILFWSVFVWIFSSLVAKGGFLFIGALFALIFTIFFVYFSIRNPGIPLRIAIIFSFFAIGLTRYIDAPIGLGMDFLLVLTWIGVGLTRQFTFDWKKAKNFPVLFVVVWFLYIVLQLFNPESLGTEPWFYAMRGMALYPVLIFPLLFILLKQEKDINWLIIVWFSISVLAGIKGFIQKYGDCDPFEKIWLAQGGAVTHVLFGQLRAFSFYSDAGQFGAAMSHAALSSFILGTGPYKKWLKTLFFILFVFFFWGYLISGTRGAIAVFASGVLVYLILSKNFKLLLWGGILIGGFYYFMAFTTIGQGTYEIRRLRTAFTEGSEDASMQVRLDNQKKLKGYLADKPFGGGVGSAGDWGRRFHPDSVLANIATDSYYVRIYAETGIVGLTLILVFFGYFVVFGAFKIWFIKDAEKRNKLLALYCGLVGILVASYGNSVFSQFPTAFVCYVSMCLIELQPKPLLHHN